MVRVPRTARPHNTAYGIVTCDFHADDDPTSPGDKVGGPIRSACPPSCSRLHTYDADSTSMELSGLASLQKYDFEDEDTLIITARQADRMPEDGLMRSKEHAAIVQGGERAASN